MTYKKRGTYKVRQENGQVKEYLEVDFEMHSTEPNPTEEQLRTIGAKDGLWNGSTIFETNTFKLFVYSDVSGKWEDGDGHGRGEQNE